MTSSELPPPDSPAGRADARARNIRLVFAYDGTDFCGWQVQAEGRTIQGTIQDALERMHGHPVRLTAAGRTDSGVHASGQVANFYTDLDSIPSERWAVALNSYLPKDVRAVESEEAHPEFHSRYWAVSRTYRYYLYPGSVMLPHHRLYCHHTKRVPRTASLNRMAACLVGRHDFTTFATPKDESGSRVKTVTKASFFWEGDLLVFQIQANSFLWKMVRSIVGTILDLEEKDGTEEDFSKILQSKDRGLAGPTAPAQGLFLHKVEYEKV